MVFRAQPVQGTIEVVEGFRQPRVPVREETEYAIDTVLAGTATIGTALFPDSTMQEAIAQETAQNRQRGSIRMIHRNGAVSLGTEIHLG